MTAWQLFENIIVIMIGVASALLVLRQHAPALWARMAAGLGVGSRRAAATAPTCHRGGNENSEDGKADTHCVGGCGGCSGASRAQPKVLLQHPH